MPLYGKRPGNRPRKKPIIEAEIKRQYKPDKSTQVRTFGPPEKFGFRNTSLNQIENQLQFHIKGFIYKAAEKKRRIRVLDWGCATATAIETLASDPALQTKLEAYGYSKDSYSEWTQIQNATIIHAPHQDLPKYFRTKPLDLIFSHGGLVHLCREQFEANSPHPITRLCRLLAPNGVLVMEIFPFKQFSELLERIQIELGTKYQIRRTPQHISIRRKE